MKSKLVFALFGFAGLALCLTVFRPKLERPKPEAPEPRAAGSSGKVEPTAPGIHGASVARSRAAPGPAESGFQPAPAEKVPAAGRLERLTQIREQFRVLAAGAPKAAMDAAKQLTDETERETALLTLVTEWTHGYLRRPDERAQAIAQYGLEAGLGMELAKNPELAMLWANELTEGSNRAALLGQIANGMVRSDTAAAFGLSDSIAPEDRRQFFNSLYAGWATQDTAAALQSAEQLDDPALRDAVLQAIRGVAPVGIGAAVSMQAGYPVISDLVPDAPADVSGLLHKGDRIVALAQGDNSYVDVHNLSLQEIVQMIRGAPGTTLQLQLVSADAPAGATPHTVAIVRDQIKFKR